MIKKIRDSLKSWFDFPNNKVYCQVATIGNSHPRIRTMDFYHITNVGEVILLTDTSTNKWQELHENPRVALCLMHLDYGQIVVEGEVQLNTSETNYSLCKQYWDELLDDYWRGFYFSRKTTVVDGIPTAFGVISVSPTMWEIIETNQEDFIKSTRTRFGLVDGQWKEDFLEVS